MAASGDWRRPTDPRINSVITKEDIAVRLQTGEIQTAQADVILCTSGKDLDLSTGAVSSSLLTAAGPALQRELYRRYPKGLGKGQVGKTKGYKLSCKRVYHASLVEWKSTSAAAKEEVLRKILQESLKLANVKKMRSIAWPTIGCGNLGYPKNVVAAAMFDEVRQFSAANQGSTVREVIIVMYKGDQAVIDEYEKQLSALLGY